MTIPDRLLLKRMKACQNDTSVFLSLKTNERPNADFEPPHPIPNVRRKPTPTIRRGIITG
jgi:hypothetical protein